MSIVEELAELLAEDGSYEVYTGPDSNHIDLYRYACSDCVPFDTVFVEGDSVVWGDKQEYQFDLSRTGLEDLAQAILCTLLRVVK